VVEPLNQEEVSRFGAFDMGGGEQFKFALPGEGVVDWPEIMGALQHVGFDGVLSVGLPRGTYEAEAAARKALAFLKPHVPETAEKGPSAADDELPDLGPF